MGFDDVQKEAVKIEFCKYLQISYLKNRKLIDVNLLFAPAVITYKQEYYAFIDTVLSVLIKNDQGQYVPLPPSIGDVDNRV